MLKSLHSHGSCAANFLLIHISSILSVISPGCDLNAWECFDGPATPQQGMLGVLLSDDQPHSDYNGQWQSAEYRDMLPRPRLDLSGTPGLRPIGLSPGFWQTSLGLGSMSWYSAQILICITMTSILVSIPKSYDIEMSLKLNTAVTFITLWIYPVIHITDTHTSPQVSLCSTHIVIYYSVVIFLT